MNGKWIVMGGLAGLASLGIWAGPARGQGALDPGTAPEPAMFTLEQIYNVCIQLSQKLDEANANIAVLSNRVNQLTQTQLSSVDGPKIVEVNSNALTGIAPSLKFTPAGRPAISAAISVGMSDIDLVYYEFNGAFWEMQTVDTNGMVGLYSSLTFNNPSGYPAISYMDAGAQTLKYAGWDGTRWIIYAVDTTPGCGNYSSLDFNGWLPAIAHYESNGKDLRFSRWNGSSWENSFISSAEDSGAYCSFKYNSQGHPCVSFRRVGATANLMYSTKPVAEFNWNTTYVDNENGTGVGTSLAFTPEGNPAISHICDTNYALKYSQFNGTTWDNQTVNINAKALWTSLSFTPQGYPAICYVDAYNKLNYAEYTGIAWKFQVVDVANNVYPHSMAFTPAGRAAIAYTEGYNTTLNYAELIPLP